LVRGQAEEAYDFTRALIGQADRMLYFVRSPRPYIVLRDDLRTENGGETAFVSRYATYPGNRIEQAGDAVILHGQRHGGTALLAAFSGTTPVALHEDDLTGVALRRRGTDIPYGSYLSRISTRFTAESSELLSFVIPFEGRLPPQIAVAPGPDRHSYLARITFADGAVDRLLLAEGDIMLLQD
jgi:hypothetical protein